MKGGGDEDALGAGLLQRAKIIRVAHAAGRNDPAPVALLRDRRNAGKVRSLAAADRRKGHHHDGLWPGGPVMKEGGWI